MSCVALLSCCGDLRGPSVTIAASLMGLPFDVAAIFQHSADLTLSQVPYSVRGWGLVIVGWFIMVRDLVGWGMDGCGGT